MAKGLMHIHVPMTFFEDVKQSEVLSIPEFTFSEDGKYGMVLDSVCAIENIGNLFITFAEFVVKYCDGVTYEEFKAEVMEVFDAIQSPGGGEHGKYHDLRYTWSMFAHSWIDRVNGMRTRKAENSFEHAYKEHFGK